MQFSNLIIAAAALISSGSQAAVIPRQDSHIVDFRTYGLPGCYEQNQGVYTFTLSQTNICYDFVVEPVESIFVTDISDGYSLFAYTESACSGEQITVPVGIANCYDQADGLGSYKVVPINGTSV